MNKNNKLFWAVILLLVLNVTTIATIIWQNRSVSGPTNCLRVASEGCKLTGKNIDRQLDFNAEQMEVFKQANQLFAPRSCMILCRLDSLKNEMFTELHKDPSDSLRLDSLAVLIGDQHAALKERPFSSISRYRRSAHPNKRKNCKRSFTLCSEMIRREVVKGKDFVMGRTTLRRIR